MGRVPCLVVSPYARRGINHTFYSHASIVKFCLRQFALKAWNAPALLPHHKRLSRCSGSALAENRVLASE